MSLESTAEPRVSMTIGNNFVGEELPDPDGMMGKPMRVHIYPSQEPGEVEYIYT